MGNNQSISASEIGGFFPIGCVSYTNNISSSTPTDPSIPISSSNSTNTGSIPLAPIVRPPAPFDLSFLGFIFWCHDNIISEYKQFYQSTVIFKNQLTQIKVK